MIFQRALLREFTNTGLVVFIVLLMITITTQLIRILGWAAQGVIAPDGVLIIKVPNYGSVNRRVFGRRWCGFRFPDHMNYFTPESLVRLCAECGLGVRAFSWLDRLPTSDNMWLVAGRA